MAAMYKDIKKFTQINTVHNKTSKSFMSISKGARILLSSGFRKKNFNGKKITHVILYYSKLDNTIVFDFIKDSKDKAALVLTNSSNEGRTITFSIAAFVKFYEININKIKGKYTPKLEKIPDLGDKWTIQLKK